MSMDRDLRGAPDKRLLGFDEHARASLADFRVEACCVCVVSHGKIGFAKAFSSSNNKRASVFAGFAENESAAGPDSPWLFGNLSNLIALALGKLAENNKELKEYSRALLSNSLGLNASLLAELAADLPVIASPATSAFLKASTGQYNPSPLTAPLAAHLATTLAQSPIEVLMHDLVLSRFGASRISGFSSLGREDSSMGLTISARDLARLVACLLDKSWGPVDASVLEEMLTPYATLNPSDVVESAYGDDFIDYFSDFKVLNCGWIQSTFRDKFKRIGFNGTGANGGSYSVVWFPDHDFGIVVVCDMPSFLPIALSCVASDFMLGFKPGPWVPRLEGQPYPFGTIATLPNSSLELGSSAPPRSLHYYVGTYTCPECPVLAFKIQQLNGALVIRFLNGQTEHFQPNCVLLYSENVGAFCFTAKSFLPKHLSVSRFANQTCGVLFENSVDGSVASLSFFESLSDVSKPSKGVYFSKSVAYQSPTSTNASAFSSARPSTASTIPQFQSARLSTSLNAAPPSLPPRRTPDISRQPSSLSNNPTPTPSLQPPTLPPRSRATSSTTSTSINTSTTIVTPTPITSPPPTYSGAPPPTLIPLDKSSDQDLASVRLSNSLRAATTSSSSNIPPISPPPQYSSVTATLDKLLVRSTESSPTRSNATEDLEDEELRDSLEEISKDMEAVDDLFKEMGME
ncbi:UNVERIFIED_CONTAM: hypothetical protein HDU68_002423 [Siphonaria sp. JEL0065]|nr:hypothetical protein HDU68_002423 [Siphonaria sp. JEL0065]